MLFSGGSASVEELRINERPMCTISDLMTSPVFAARVFRDAVETVWRISVRAGGGGRNERSEALLLGFGNV